MKNTATFRRNAAAIGLVATAVLSTLSAMTAPEFPAGGAERLDAIAANLSSSAVSAAAFTLAQLPFIAAVLGLGHLLRSRAPVLSNVATTLAVLGAFGHTVFGGGSLLYVAMATDEAQHATYGPLIDDFESSPAMTFAAIGLVGTVLGLILLAVGLWRARVAPRWVPIALGAFIVVEFVGGSVSDWASQVASLIYLVSFTALAVAVWRTHAQDWATSPAQVEEPAPARA